jgi:hypothetical protein
MAVTYNQIATSTITGNPTTFTLSSIPSGYTDLRLILFTGANSTAEPMTIYFNGVNTGTQYGWQVLRKDSSATFTTSKNINQATFTTTQNLNAALPYNLFMMDLFNYTDTASAKQVQWSLGQTNAASPSATQTSIVSGQWSSTSAITSITVGKATGGFYNPSVISLYGILRA